MPTAKTKASISRKSTSRKAVTTTPRTSAQQPTKKAALLTYIFTALSIVFAVLAYVQSQ